MPKTYQRLKIACFTANVGMSIVSNLSPLLFITFNRLYDVSYTLLGLLVLINFTTQLTVDLIFSFFPHKFNIPRVVRLIPLMTATGLVIYALSPFLLPNHIYACLVLGTVIFSASGGFAEVLISPVIAAIPAENPDREMSKLHSVYAWGCVGVILLGTLFLWFLGETAWPWLVLLFALVPVAASFLFMGVTFPPLDSTPKGKGNGNIFRKGALWLCVFGIFLGGAAECTMAQWVSGYLEQAVGIPKLWGDIFGVALFSVMLGLGRSLYGKIGKNIYPVLCAGAAGATLCYVTAVFTNIPMLGLVACAFTGFCVSMLWPGSLIAVSDRFPTGGVVIFALMAAGGDLGASVGPQLVGIITDAVKAGEKTALLTEAWGLTPERLGMKCGLLVGAVFSLIALAVYLIQWRNKTKVSRKIK